jgi:hypothetical protein
MNVTHTGDEKCIDPKNSSGKPKGKKPLGRPKLSRRIILKWIKKKLGVKGGLDSPGS